MSTIASLCVFCGSNTGAKPAYTEAAQTLGRLLAGREITLVYGGGKVGLMGTVADAALQAGGKVTGVIPQSLVEKEVDHTGLTELHVVGSMHERKALMADLSDGFIALAGGMGTLDELFEILTWAQLGFHAKPIGLVNTLGYYDHLLAFLQNALAEGFVRDAHLQTLLVEREAERLFQRMYDFAHVRVGNTQMPYV